ncbi:MAG TPA: lysophospholipid acyltransferase family protein [Gaiellaceae bacterium]|nr:lysophospholipid acyltransferase family protein [Gaiellaceae bacterium]
MTRPQWAWLFFRPPVDGLVRVFAPLRIYGRDRLPLHGPLVLCFNHFSWLDPWALGGVCPRTIYYVAKQEAHDNPLIGPFIRFFGTSSIRRGESDREAIRVMREVVRRGDTLGMFPEGTRQKSEPGEVRSGAAMIAVQEQVPVVCGAIEGSQRWRLGNFEPVSIAFGEPFDLSGHPRNSQGYRAASLEIQAEIRRLWEFLVVTHEHGRPRVAIPPA